MCSSSRERATVKMDRIRDAIAERHYPELISIQQCKKHGSRMGFYTFILAGSTSYVAFQLPLTLIHLRKYVPSKYQLPAILGFAVVCSYVMSAYTTRRCIKAHRSQQHRQ